MNVHLPTSFFPPISWYVLFYQAENVSIDYAENFVKQTKRSRAEIGGAEGRQNLSVPIKKKGSTRVISQTQVSYESDWRMRHFKTLQACYRSTPYFEFFEDKLEGFYTLKQRNLTELNHSSIKLINDWIGIDKKFEPVSKYIPDHQIKGIHFRDFKANMALPKYPQRFENKTGFMEDLSILDLVFSLGKKSIQVLEQAEVETL